MKREEQKNWIAITMVFIFLLLIVIKFTGSSEINEERYIIKVSGKKYLNPFLEPKIVELIEEPKKLKQVGSAKIGISMSKKLVIQGVNKEILKKDDSIVYIEPDYIVKSLGSVTPWNFEAIGVDFSKLNEDFGKDVKIAVLDTGSNNIQIISGYDFVNEDNNAYDDNGHGTHVTEILKSSDTSSPLYKAEVYSVKVLDEKGEGYVSDVIEGINWAIDNNIDIVLMSFGGEGDSLFLKEAINNAYNEGVLLIAAVGNNGKELIVYPAAYRSVISVGSVNENFERSGFSNFGEGLEFVAPGENIEIANNILEGTSFAVPHVGIVVASFLSENQEMNNHEIRKLLQESVIDLGVVGRDIFYGYGLSIINLSEKEGQGSFPINDSDDINEEPKSSGVGGYSIKEFKNFNRTYPKGPILSKQRMKYEKDRNEITIEIIKYNSSEFLMKNFQYALSQGLKEKFDKKNYYFSHNNIYGWVSGDYLVQLIGLDSFSYENKLVEMISNQYPPDSSKMNLSKDFLISSDFETLAISCSDYGYSSCLNLFDEKRVEDTRYECNAFGWFGLKPWCWEPVAYNGNSDFCTSKAKCDYGQYDCDLDSQCKSRLDCVDYDGGACLLWQECGCCNSDEKWNKDFNICVKLSCESYGRYYGGCTTKGQVKRQGNNLLKCKDQIVFGEFLCWDKIGYLGDSDFCYQLKKIGSGCGMEEYGCDNHSECLEGLICDKQGSIIVNDGCCYNYENWNGEDHSCNKAVHGKIYKVNQYGQNFYDSSYKNLKLRVFIEDDDLIEDDVLWYFDVQTDSYGNFKFNPERYVSNWNWIRLFVDYKIHDIYAVENNEVIGKWSNQFSNENKFKKGRESVHQIVRIYKDKYRWKKYSIPEAEKGEAFAVYSTSNLKKLESSNEEYIFLKWSGKLNISDKGHYIFKFNVTGEVLLKINNKTYIDTFNTENKNKSTEVYLENKENDFYFEFYEKPLNYPLIFWAFEDNKLKEIKEENLIKHETDIKIINNKNLALKTLFSNTLVNNDPDYLISFLESPEQINYKNPLVFVHGKHGESGYWEDDSQNHFNDLGYDSWEFYYPGDDYINVSGALLGDSLDFLKDNYYGSSQKFDVITHSMGGLVARSYVQNISPYSYQEDINHLILIGSPNYGAGASTGITHEWEINDILKYWKVEEVRLSPDILIDEIKLHPTSWLSNIITDLISGNLIGGDILLYILIKKIKLNLQDIKYVIDNMEKDKSNSPIYKQMSFGSSLIEELDLKDLNVNTQVIIGNEGLNILDPTICSVLFFFHKEADVGENDCLVPISSSSLLEKGAVLSIINNKDHIEEANEITDYSSLITSFLNDKSDYYLARESYAYYNPKTGYKRRFYLYDEGSVQIKLMNGNEIWNKFSNQDIRIEKLDYPYKNKKFNLTRNIYSKNYFHFNRKSDEVDSFYTLPKGEYRLIVPGYEDEEKFHFEIKPMETNFLEINLAECSFDNDCDEDYYTYNYCMGKDVYHDFHDYSCVNGGCVEDIAQEFVEECNEDEICENSKCKLIQLGLCTIHSPKNNSIYNTRRIFFNITASENLAKINYIDYSKRRPRWKRLCNKCDKYEKEKSFKGREHEIIVRCTSHLGETGDHKIIFSNDYKKPRISKTLPRRNSFTNGSDFYVRYSEENVDYIQLKFIQGLNTFEISDTNLSLETSNFETQIIGSIGNARMILKMERGEEVEKYILVKNINNVPVNIELSPEGDLKDYIKITRGSFLLQPNEEKKAYFTIRNELRGITESKIKVQFTPNDGGKGVSLTSKIIVITKNFFISGKNKEYHINYDLSNYDNQTIFYYFIIKDIVGNTATSKPTKVKVDTTPPTINSLNYTIKRKRIEFIINITEENFYRVEYKDLNLNVKRQRWKRLCSRLKNGICKRKIRFRGDSLNISIRVLDKAGNSNLKEVS